MEAIVKFVQAYEEIIVVTGFAAVCLAILIYLILILKKIRCLQKTIDKIVKNVDEYLRVVCSEEDGQALSMSPAEAAAREKTDREEKENRIISEVLQEIFP